MKRKRLQLTVTNRLDIDRRLAGYLAAAGAVGAVMASDAEAVPVGSHAVQPFGINGVVSVDFNQDGQTDFQIDHDRYNLNGNLLDYLQIDKNDINSESPSEVLLFDPGPDATFQATPFMNGVTARNDANESAYVIAGPQGSYPAALTLGTPIGPASTFDFQETANFQGGGKDIRANRLIDEDATQIDQILGGQPASGVQVPFTGPNFVGLAGQIRYLGLKMDLNNANLTNYGWIGIRITNEADATGEVVGWGYETLPGVPILAGTVPEPSTITSVFLGGAAIAGFLWRRLRRR
jgi:hypothetical protein